MKAKQENKVDLRTCRLGQKLRSKHGMILTYLGPSGNPRWPHLVAYSHISHGTRTDDGFVFSNPSARFPTDHDIVEILPMDTPCQEDRYGLWSFTWKDCGGYNSVYANNAAEAIEKSKQLWSGHVADYSSLRFWEDEREYYKELPNEN